MDREYRATKTVHHDGKLYEVGKVYDLPVEAGDAMPWLVAEVDTAAAPAGEGEPQVVGTSTMVLINITGGAPDAETRAKLDELIASSGSLGLRVTLDDLAARAIAALASPVPVEFTVPADLVSEGTTAPAAGGTEPAPTIAAVNAAFVDKDNDGKPDRVKKAKAAKADTPQT